MYGLHGLFFPHLTRAKNTRVRYGAPMISWFRFSVLSLGVMPAGLVRFQASRQSHFVTFSCYHRLPKLQPRLRDLFLVCLEQTRGRYALRVYGYVAMPEHVHLLVSEPERKLLATAMQSLKLAVVRRAAGITVPFWLPRYHDHNVRDYESFVEKLRYIHRNPVKRGLVKRPEDWAWSSFRHYATGERGVVEVESEWAAKLRQGEPKKPPE
jgi:putative transposase